MLRCVLPPSSECHVVSVCVFISWCLFHSPPPGCGVVESMVFPLSVLMVHGPWSSWSLRPPRSSAAVTLPISQSIHLLPVRTLDRWWMTCGVHVVPFLILLLLVFLFAFILKQHESFQCFSFLKRHRTHMEHKNSLGIRVDSSAKYKSGKGNWWALYHKGIRNYHKADVWG